VSESDSCGRGSDLLWATSAYAFVCVRATASSPSIWSQICLVVGGFVFLCGMNECLKLS